MYVLGISCYYHDSGAALVCDGELVAAAEEERFNRIKHYSDFPKHAVDYCLAEAGITIADVDYITFYEKPLVKFNRILETILARWPLTYRNWVRSMPIWLLDKLRIGKTIQEELATDKDIYYCQHHLAHAASAFLVSPYEEAAVITADGVGEWTTTAWGVGRGTEITFEKEIRFPHSVGLLFSAITAYLGFRVNDAEWKVMGLAPYGKPTYVDKFREVVDIRDDGSFRLNMRYFTHTHSTEKMFSRAWEELFGRPQRPSETELDEFPPGHRPLRAEDRRGDHGQDGHARASHHGAGQPVRRRWRRAELRGQLADPPGERVQEHLHSTGCGRFRRGVGGCVLPVQLGAQQSAPIHHA
jgi:carbamoyltransferase